jgi:hypothetical protein
LSPEDFRGFVPQRSNLVGEIPNGNSKGTTETKICQFQLAPTVDEQVLGLEISVHDSIGVAEFNAAQQLMHE